MKHIRNIALCGLAFSLVFGVSSCTEKESPEAKAVIAESDYIEFAATNAEAKVITVYADGDWTVDAPDWISVSPEKGSGTTEGVSISAADNSDASGILLPRRDTVIFHGAKLISYSYVIVYQNGDKYRGAVDATISSLASVKDGNFVNVSGAMVMASDGSKIVLSDGSANMLLSSKQSVSAGDVVSFRGVKGTEGGLPTVSELEDFKITSSSEPSYPEATDISTTLDALSVSAPQYVSVSGVYDGSSLTVEGAGKTVSGTSSTEDLGALSGHKATFIGYAISANASKVIMIVTKVVDGGLDQVIYFRDDFEWLEPWTTASGAGDAVGTNTPDTTAPNIFTTLGESGFFEEFTARGYGYIWGPTADGGWSDSLGDDNPKVMYLQTNYLKFGKTSYNAGIKLPKISAITGKENVELSFDWCWQITGAAKPDLMTLSINVEGGGEYVGGEIESAQSQVDGESRIEWQHVSVVLNDIGPESRIVISPTNPNPITSNTRKQNRWYLDNILIVPTEGGSNPGGGDNPGGGGSASGTVLLEDDFEWLSTWAGAEAKPAGDAVGTNTPGAAAPNVFTAETCVGFIEAFTEKGYTYIWGPTSDGGWSDSLGSDNPKVMYLQSNYLKFGKTSYNAGIKLPVLAALASTSDVEFTFDWCWQITGEAKPDLMTLSIDIEGNG
ncbi:MAG: hypothetical protein K6F21_03995, partial [Bacteroidales bacterium]|nr:hypothetical protein [Bacteroidales bacterium]